MWAVATLEGRDLTGRHGDYGLIEQRHTLFDFSCADQCATLSLQS